MTFPTYRISVRTVSTGSVSEDVTAKNIDNLRRNLIESYKGTIIEVSEIRRVRGKDKGQMPLGILTVSPNGQSASWRMNEGNFYSVDPKNGRLDIRLV